MSTFKREVSTSMDLTQEKINQGWESAVQCTEDNLCCRTSIEEWTTINKTVETLIERLKRKYT